MSRGRLKAADRERIADVFEQHRGFVEAVAIQHAGRDDAPDVVAEVGLRLCTSLNGLREPDALRAWIYRVTVSAARDLHKQRVRLERTREAVQAVSSPSDAILEPDEYLRDNRRRDAFLEALNRLKNRDRRLICNSLGLERVSVSDGADRVALHRARQRLREALLTDPRLTE
jgi:RNA polymerase sigma factor (sigma-70 family)